MLDEKDLKMIDEIFAHRLNVVMESAITPKLNLLAQGQQTLLETLAPKKPCGRAGRRGRFLEIHRQAAQPAGFAELKKAQ